MTESLRLDSNGNPGFAVWGDEHPKNDSFLLAGIEKFYSTSEAAAFFPAKRTVKDPVTGEPILDAEGKPVRKLTTKSTQWLYWGMRNEIFTHPDGTPIEPKRIGKGKRRRFTLQDIRDIAVSCHRRGNLKEPELRDILKRVWREENS